MFGIGTGELLLLFIIALVVLGPERLPGLARDLGKAMQDLRKTSDELTSEFLRADQEAKKAAEAPPAVTETAATEPAMTPPQPEAAGEQPTLFDQEAQRAADEHAQRPAEQKVPEGWSVPKDTPEAERFG